LPPFSEALSDVTISSVRMGHCSKSRWASSLEYPITAFSNFSRKSHEAPPDTIVTDYFTKAPGRFGIAGNDGIVLSFFAYHARCDDMQICTITCCLHHLKETMDALQ
jgi:hypothetical protein